MKIEVLSPHGFCGGVARAIKMAQEALAEHGREGNGTATVYCLHEIVHSEQVVQELTAKGMRFVESVEEVPKGAVLLISAHGAPPAVFDVAAWRAQSRWRRRRWRRVGARGMAALRSIVSRHVSVRHGEPSGDTREFCKGDADCRGGRSGPCGSARVFG